MKQFLVLLPFMWVCSNDVMCAVTSASQCVFFLLVVNAWLEDPTAATAEGWRKQSGRAEAAKDGFVHQRCVCPLGSQQLEMSSHHGSCL